jgi:hypothetical protein
MLNRQGINLKLTEKNLLKYLSRFSCLKNKLNNLNNKISYLIYRHVEKLLDDLQKRLFENKVLKNRISFIKKYGNNTDNLFKFCNISVLITFITGVFCSMFNYIGYIG